MENRALETAPRWVFCALVIIGGFVAFIGTVESMMGSEDYHQAVRLDAGGTLYGSSPMQQLQDSVERAEHLSDRLCGRMTTLIGVVLFCTGLVGYSLERIDGRPHSQPR